MLIIRIVDELLLVNMSVFLMKVPFRPHKTLNLWHEYAIKSKRGHLLHEMRENVYKDF